MVVVFVLLCFFQQICLPQKGEEEKTSQQRQRHAESTSGCRRRRRRDGVRRGARRRGRRGRSGGGRLRHRRCGGCTRAHVGRVDRERRRDCGIRLEDLRRHLCDISVGSRDGGLRRSGEANGVLQVHNHLHLDGHVRGRLEEVAAQQGVERRRLVADAIDDSRGALGVLGRAPLKSAAHGRAKVGVLEEVHVDIADGDVESFGVHVRELGLHGLDHVGLEERYVHQAHGLNRRGDLEDRLRLEHRFAGEHGRGDRGVDHTDGQRRSDDGRNVGGAGVGVRLTSGADSGGHHGRARKLELHVRVGGGVALVRGANEAKVELGLTLLDLGPEALCGAGGVRLGDRELHSRLARGGLDHAHAKERRGLTLHLLAEDVGDEHLDLEGLQVRRVEELRAVHGHGEGRVGQQAVSRARGRGVLGERARLDEDAPLGLEQDLAVSLALELGLGGSLDSQHV
eukprot:PhM_4_TR16400/c0_g1_i2/m.61775